MSKFIRYNSDHIQSFRPNKNTIISEKLSKQFDWINELFLESTQYQDNRKKINYNQINSQKWRSNNINIVNSILLMLNGIDTAFYDDIEQKILNTEVKDINNMRKIIEIFHEKTCESFNAPVILNLYTNILFKIINNGIWYYKIGDKVTDYICPRIVAVSIAQKNYLEMLDTFLSIIDNYNKTNDEVSYYKVVNQKFIGNLLFIGKLFNKKIISIEIINNICKDILLKINTDIKNVDLLEYLIQLLNTIDNYPNMDNLMVELNQLVTKLSNRNKYLLMNFIESQTNKKIKDNNVKLENNNISINNVTESYNNLIMEYLINFNEANIGIIIDDFINGTKCKVDGELILSILRKFNYNSEHKLLTLVTKLLEKKVLSKEMIDTKINLYKSNGELDEIAEESPLIHQFVDKLQK